VLLFWRIKEPIISVGIVILRDPYLLEVNVFMRH